jgi:hypothetical protein
VNLNLALSTLESGGPVVKNRKQAIAIAISQASKIKKSK